MIHRRGQGRLNHAAAQDAINDLGTLYPVSGCRNMWTFADQKVKGPAGTCSMTVALSTRIEKG